MNNPIEKFPGEKITETIRFAVELGARGEPEALRRCPADRPYRKCALCGTWKGVTFYFGAPLDPKCAAKPEGRKLMQAAREADHEAKRRTR